MNSGFSDLIFELPDSKEQLLKDHELQAWAKELTRPFNEGGAGLQVTSIKFELSLLHILGLEQLLWCEQDW